jgi:hypothetical protein
MGKSESIREAITMSAAFRPMPVFTGKERLKLLRYDEFMGTITNLDSDWPWMIGMIQLEPTALTFKPLWDFWTTDDNFGEQPPFEMPKDFEEGWFIELENGELDHICFPAVHSDGEIWWRGYVSMADEE